MRNPINEQLEKWRPVVGYEGHYEVSSLGRVRSLERPKVDRLGRKYLIPNRILRQYPCPQGYMKVKLYQEGVGKTQRVHRLVALAFLEAPAAPLEVNHLDRNMANNHVANLEWSTRSENMVHAHEVGGVNHTKGEDHYCSVLTADMVREARRRVAAGERKSVVAREFGVSYGSIKCAVARKTWKHID